MVILTSKIIISKFITAVIVIAIIANISQTITMAPIIKYIIAGSIMGFII
jgi:hypothetical protein